jgi:hypothetical protein
MLTVSALLVAFALFAASAGYLARLSYRILHFGKYPPPGSVVFFRTRVYTGKQAVITGYVFILASAVVAANAFLTGYVIWLSVVLAFKV